MHSASFSADGSLVAVGTQSGVVLFDSDSCTCSAFLASPFPKRPKSNTRFAHVCFLSGSAYVAAAHVGTHGGGVCVWNLLTLTPWWIAEGDVRDLCAHPSKPWLAAVVGGRDQTWGLMEVDASSGKVESWWEQRGDEVARVLYAPSHSALCSRLQRSAVLLAVSEARRVMILKEQNTKVMELEGLDVADVTTVASLRSIFGEGGDKSEIPPDGANKWRFDDTPSRQAIDCQLLSADSHLLPAPPDLCSRVLESFLRERT